MMKLTHSDDETKIAELEEKLRMIQGSQDEKSN